MDTLEFFRATMPDEGPYFLAIFKDTHKAPAHKHFDTLEEMADAAIKLGSNTQLSVYHACASYKAHHVMVGSKKSYRVPENWNRAKALWLDLDCGEEKAAKGHGYLTKKDAATAILTFCKKTGFPDPMIVDSGNGLHCYWPLTKAILPAAWKALATAFKAALTAEGVLQDGTRTSDFASILRPPGTVNRKRDPKPVVVKRVAGPYAPADLRDILNKGNSKPAAASLEVPSYVKDAQAHNEDLTAHGHVNIPSSARDVADKCHQVRLMRDTKGDVSYDHWRLVIGLIKHCEEGVELAKEWSTERVTTGHTNDDVDTRYNTWNAGPPICETLNVANPGGCDGCPFRGKVKTPIVLGRKLSENQPVVVDAIADGKKATVEIPPLPENYKWENNKLVHYLKNKDGILEAFPFCKTLFYPTYRVYKEDGGFCLGIRMHLPDGRWRDFEVDTGLLASPTKLMEDLGHRGEIVQINTKDSANHMTAYLRESLERLKHKAEELNTMTSFGWKYDMTAFLVGDRLYHQDGTMRRVLVGGYALDYILHFPEPRGTVEGYAKAVNHVYAIEGMEPLQYAFCSGFGSILTPFGETLYKGLLVALTGGETAKGKTTVCQASLYGFGDAKRMTIKTEKGATNNMQYASMGTYGSLPMLFDEFTSIEPQVFSEFAYRVSLGEEKGRMRVGKSGAVRKAEQVEWALSPYVTANKDLHAVLAANTSNSQAEAVRMIQIKVDEYDIPQYGDGEVDSALSQMRINAGSAGDAFIKYVVAHRDDIFTMFQETIGKLSAAIPGPKYRYYRNHAAATLTAAQLMNKLGIAAFDYGKLFLFTTQFMSKLSTSVTESNMLTNEDALSNMINDLTPRIITTTEFRDRHDARGPEKVNRVNGAVAGRYVLGSSNAKDASGGGKLYLSRKDAKDWCMKQRIELDNVLKFASDAGVLDNPVYKVSLTKGTELPSPNITCIVIDMHKLESMMSNKPKLVVHGLKLADNNAVAVGSD